MSRIMFWQNIPCPLKSSWIRALAATGDVQVTVVAESESLSWRQAMGWVVPDHGRATVILCRDLKTIRDLVAGASDETVHIVGGLRGCPLVTRVLPELARRGARVGVISEAADGTGWRGLVRRGIYYRDRARFAPSIDFVLAMGILGVAWFTECGYPAERLFPFAYVTEQIERYAPRPAGNRPTSLIYVGQFVPRKGLDILLEALRGLRELNWELTMVGSGPMENEYRRIVRKNGLSEKVHFLGPLRNQAARLEICRSDLLLLPSRYDGWGAVVNEALMTGVPAICSDRCGARDLLQEPWRGEVFAAGSVSCLRNALERRINARRTDAVAKRIRDWSRLIEGESLATYFLSILNFVYANDARPMPPWLRVGQDFALPDLGAAPRYVQ